MDMVPVCFCRQQIPAKTSAEVRGMIFHKIADLIRNNGTPIFGDKYDMVCQKIYLMNRSRKSIHDPASQDTSLRKWVSTKLNNLMLFNFYTL